ncbi:fimbria/pilus outer membrane usher protein [Acinetobacter sp. MD2(2019)]|uniref:fimbria/pilus outer membrane usher protein n=1 Tax=Acinetobacter sp. MD2(2019) TaxID=2605273 RepID=UPI002D1EB0BD|nr:fimbria/pilus outer membrane usher protein [Acinetobacter sp. MD2(2019)]MEB3754356.1 fimbrial biogenesis outer membrane usher protein [Acinetobacter sp. MD2(2019)]
MKRSLLSILILVQMQSIFADDDLDPNVSNSKPLQAENNKTLYSYDTHALFGGASQDIDLRQYTRANAVTSGLYSVNTSINNRSIGNLNLKFDHLDASQDAVLCIDSDLLEKLDLKEEVLQRLPHKECLTIKDINSDAYYDFDRSQLELNFSLPLVITNNRPAGYIAPDRFDKGISSAFISYDFNTYRYQYNHEQASVSNYLNLAGGINLGGFNYRHEGSFDSQGSRLGTYHSSLNTLSTDILALKSRITIGDFNTQAYDIDSAQIRGAQLATDMSMRPMSQRSYAPLIKGNANTNALVSIFQGGRKVYERSVPAGNFEINDLTAISSNGNLTVQVTENGGEKHSFIVPLQGNFNLIRLGQLNYSAATGKYKINQKVTDTYISQLSLEYGLSNYVSIHSGVNLSQPYKSYLLGLGSNTFFGGFKVDIEHADAELLNQLHKGNKYQASYQFNFKPTQTNITLNAQYQDKEFLSMNNTLSLLNYNDLAESEIENIFQTYRLKQQQNISLYQNLKDKWGTFYVSASRNEYWNANKDYMQYNVGYANFFKKLNYSINFSQSSTSFYDNKTERRIYLTFTLPLDWSNKHANLYSNIQHSDIAGNPTSAVIGVSGTLGSNNQMDYGLSVNSNIDGYQNNQSLSASVGYNLPQIRLNSVASISNTDQQFGFSAQGAFVAHRHGITASNAIADTFTIIHADGATDADVNNAWGVKIDRFGNAIYSSLSPYEVNELSVDTRNLPVNVNLKANQAEIIPRRYSSTLIEFETEKTSNLLFNVHTDKGVEIPIGAQAMDSKNNILGVFGQSNQLFIEKEKFLKSKEIFVYWGAINTQSCVIKIPSKINLSKKAKSKTFQIIDVECR